MEELKSLVEKLQDSKKYNFTKLADVINNYISNKSKPSIFEPSSFSCNL